MSTIRSHLGFIRNVALLALSIAILVLGVWAFRTTHAQASPGVVDNNLLAVALIRSGLPAENLCAAGVSSQAVTGVVHDFEETLAADVLGLSGADSALATARVQEDDLSRMIRAGKATAEQVTSLPAAASQLQSAQTQRENELNDLFNAGSADLSAMQRTLLSRIRDNGKWEVPTAYLVVNRTQAEWVALRDALANERIAAQSGDPTDPAAAALLTQVRNDPTVSAALANLEANLPAIASAWNQAVFAP